MSCSTKKEIKLANFNTREGNVSFFELLFNRTEQAALFKAHLKHHFSNIQTISGSKALFFSVNSSISFTMPACLSCKRSHEA